jgi:hypothetical protein
LRSVEGSDVAGRLPHTVVATLLGRCCADGFVRPRRRAAMRRRPVEISVNGDFGERSEAEFDGVVVTVKGGVTRMRLLVRDASALHGILNRLHALGLELLTVHPLDETPPP